MVVVVGGRGRGGFLSEFYQLIFPKKKKLDFILKQAIFLRNCLKMTLLTFHTIELAE